MDNLFLCNVHADCPAPILCLVGKKSTANKSLAKKLAIDHFMWKHVILVDPGPNRDIRVMVLHGTGNTADLFMLDTFY